LVGIEGPLDFVGRQAVPVDGAGADRHRPEKGYRDGWIAHQYKRKFGTWPPRNIVQPEKLDPDVLGWVRSQQIASARQQGR
jgi:hypothetical protein